jgi:hypothetical protein
MFYAVFVASQAEYLCEVLGCVTVGWLDLLHLYTLLGTTSNYSAIANLHDWQFTTAPAKPIPGNGFNSGDSLASRPQVLPSPTLVQNCQPAIPSTELDRRLFSASLAELNCSQYYQTSALFFYNHFARTE